MTKHTPGPWERIGSMDEDGECRIRQISSVRHGDGFYSERTICDEVRSLADANLIATAPDLLADLQIAAAHLRKYETLHRAKDTLESLAKAEVNADLAERFEKTIAKATA